MVPNLEANREHLGIWFSIFYTIIIRVLCVLIMSTHNIQFNDEIRKIP